MSGIYIQNPSDYETAFEPYYRETEAVRVFHLANTETVIFHMQRGITGTFQAVPGQDEAEIYYVRRGSIRLVPLDEEPKLLESGAFFALNARSGGILFYVKQDLELLCVSSTHTYLDNMSTTRSVDKLLTELQEKDGNSRNHGERVRMIVMKMITHMEHFDSALLEVLLQASRMHDVGKIHVPLNILLKPGPLTDEEYELMKKHVFYSAEITKELFHGQMAPVVLHQHEWWDGTGYPDGLKGEEIPLASRLIAVADAFDALVVTQPYHRGVPRVEALAEIARKSGTQFDPACVKALERAIDDPDFSGEDDVILKKTETSVDASQKEHAKRDFLSNMSHDMRTPMNAILNLTALAKEDALSDKNRDRLLDDLDKIELSSQFLLGLVDDILDVARMDSGRISMKPSVCYPHEMCDYLTGVIMPLCRERDITFTCDEVLFPVPVLIDKVRFQQIFFNLLSNAIKYSDPGSTVSLRAERMMQQEDTVQVDYVFADHGIGMSEGFQQKLFTPFEREDAGDSRMGTGLGLAITKRIVDQMGGMITVKSKPCEGTTITVHLELPVASAAKQEEERLLQSQKEKASHYFDIAGAHILLVEDHPLNREIALRLLRKVGAEVDTAENGKAALDLFAASAPGAYDAILMDVRMPVMDGLTATRKIRALPRPDARTVPIIAMTAEAFEQHRKETLAAGMNVHLSKPIKPSELFRTLAVEISSRK